MMGRPRKYQSDKRLPPCVYPRRDRNCYIFRKGRDKPVRLCSMDASISEVWECYESLSQAEAYTLRWLLDEYNNSAANKRRTIAAQDKNTGYRNSLVNYSGSRGGMFDDMLLTDIKRTMIRRYLVKAEHPVGANRHIQHLKAVWNWASQLYDQVPNFNPCEKVTLNEESPRTRYIEDWEFELVKEVILTTTRSPYLAVMMELAYLCRLRCAEVRALKVSDVQSGHVRIVRDKGSKGELTRISPSLRAAINAARAIHPGAPSPISGAYLLHSSNGSPIHKSQFDSAWDRVMSKALTKGLTERFNFHDLKAKGVSDHTDHESGHLTKKAREIYIRRLQEVDATR